MKDKKTYAGKIKNAGTQTVEAVFPQEKTKGSKKLMGGDIRTKGGRK